MLRAAIAFSVIVALVPTPAQACLNGTIMEGDEAVKALVQAEGLIDAGAYGRAYEILGSNDGTHWLVDDRLQVRVQDARMVVALRTSRRAAKGAVEYFASRSKAQPKNLRYRVWLAEAYANLNKREQALAILTDLHKRDLMPDGFGYVTLAKISPNAEVDGWLEVCRQRAKSKSICVIPQATRKAVKQTRSYKMKLPG